ncbi:unnamed protein product [Paramecium sonneborni]|uniref:Transmembrane protein n=1 Tax=Paramecium sonneborni TaxID=65129 RepID=A0A8S1L5X4_9CILI|nr:unnamed protein product [Paramecium sonneborni]
MFKNLLTIKQFYASEFYQIYNKISRNKSLSLFLILISQSQIYYIICHPFSKLFKLYARPLFLFNKFFQNINLDFNYNNTVIWSEIFLLIMLAMQLLYFFCFIYLFYNQRVKVKNNSLKKYFQTFKQKEQQNELNSIINLITVSEIYISFGAKIYKYLFYYPIIQLAFRKISTQANQYSNLKTYQFLILIIAFLVFILNILFYILNETHDVQFSFKKIDYLSRFYSNITKIQSLLIETMIIVVTILDNIEIDEIVITMVEIFLLIVILILGYSYPQYQEELINKIQIQSYSLYLSITFCILIFAEGFHKEFSELILIMLPLLFQITNLMIKQQGNKTQILSYENKNFDCLMMNIYNQGKEALGRNGILLNEIKYQLPKNLNLYAFCTNHLIFCENQNSCFCSCYKKQDDRFISRQQFKYYLKELIRFHYELKLLSLNRKTTHKQIKSYFYYILYISKVIKQPTKAFHEIIKLKNNMYSDMNLLDKMFMNSIESLVKDDFLRMIENKNITNQKYDCFKVFNYNKSVNLWKEKFRQILLKQKQWYTTLLNKDFIKLLSDGLSLQNLITDQENKLKLIFNLNPLSQQCHILIHLFYKYINFNKRKIEIPSIDSSLAYKFQNSINGILFHKEASLVYLTLLDTKGIIKNYTKTFRDALCTLDCEIMNNSINNFIPDIIAKVHDQYLDNFVERGRINIMKSDRRFLLVKNKLGFIFPIIAKVRLETDLGADFGSSALILPTYQNYHYIMLNKYGLVEEISDKLYNEFILPILCIDLKNIKLLDCLKLIPRLIKSWKTLNLTDILDSDLKDPSQSYIVIPKKSKKQKVLLSSKIQEKSTIQDYLKSQDIINEKYFDNFKQMYMFRITFKIVEFYTFQGTMYCIEIQTIKTVRESLRTEIFEKLIEKSDYVNLSRKIIKLSQEKLEIKKRKTIKFEITNQKESLGFISYQPEQQTIYNLDTQKLIEDDYMIRQKEMQIHLTNPLYILEIEECQNLISQPNSQDKKIQDQQTFRMKSSNAPSFCGLNHFGSNNSNGISQVFGSEQNKLIVHSSAILEALNENKESAKSKNSDEVIGSIENFLFDADQMQSISSSQITDIKVKKTQLKHNLFDEQTKEHWTIRIINLIIFALLIVFNIFYYYVLKQENQIIGSAIETYRLSNNFQIQINNFILSYNYSNTVKFNYTQYMKFCASHFQNDISKLQFYSPNIEQNTIPYLQISEFENITNLSLFYSLGYFSQYLLAQSKSLNQEYFLELIARNFITIISSNSALNSTVIKDGVEQFLEAQQSTKLSFYFALIFLFFAFIFYLILLIIINKAKLQIVKLFNTISKAQISCLIEQISIIGSFLEKIDFINEETTEHQFEQIKSKIASTPGIRIKTPQKKQNVKIQQNKSRENTALIYFLYSLLLLFIYFIISSQYIGSLIYQNSFEDKTIYSFKQLLLYKSCQSYLLQQKSFQKLVIKYLQINKEDMLFLNKWEDALQYMEEQLDVLQDFIQRLNDQKSFSSIIFTNTIKKNGCQAFEFEIANNNEDSQFYSQVICKNLDSLVSGLTIQLVAIQQNFQQFYSMHKQNDKRFKSYLSNMEVNSTLENDIINLLYTSHVLTLLHDFVVDESQYEISLNYLVHTIIFIFGIILYLILIIISNKNIRVYLHKELIRTKQLFLLIPLEILCENANILQQLIRRNQK